MRTFKEQTKINWNEGNYKKTLSNEEKSFFKNLNREQKDTVVMQYIKNEPINLNDENAIELIDEITKRDLSEISKIKKEQADKKQAEKVKRNEGKEKINLEKKRKVEDELKQKERKAEEFKETKALLGGYMARRGLTNLTYETQQLLIDGNYKSNLDSFQSGWAKISGNPYQNTMINTNIGQVDTNLAQIKLLDNMLKDNKILKDQNNEIIKLLKQLVEK